MEGALGAPFLADRTSINTLDRTQPMDTRIEGCYETVIPLRFTVIETQGHQQIILGRDLINQYKVIVVVPEGDAKLRSENISTLEEIVQKVTPTTVESEEGI